MQAFDSDRFHQRLDYKLFNPTVDWDTIKPLWNKTSPIQELNIQSIITAPRKPSRPHWRRSRAQLTARRDVARWRQDAVDGQNLGVVPYTVRGFAIAGGGRRIERVDLSFDGGFTWVCHLALEYEPMGRDNQPVHFMYLVPSHR